jgi:hypothetical protein
MKPETPVIIEEFFAELDRRIADPPSPEYAARLRARRPDLRAMADLAPDRFAKEVVGQLARVLGEREGGGQG